MSDQVKVPQPPLKPVIGNLAEIDKAIPVQSFMRLAREYGPIYKMQIIDREMYVVSSQALVDELSDESRFSKRVHQPLQEIRAFAKDGLFTAYNSEPNWARAHRILMPAFGPIGVRDMFPKMLDIAEQMFTRWERFGADSVIDVPDSMTRLTLDTIALCAFDYRFNSFYSDQMHPFVGAMVGALDESGKRARRPKTMTRLMLSTARRYDADIALMQTVAGDLIAERRADPNAADKDDLLTRMLLGRDPETGEGLDDENIMHQMITFLIAGHETTSGLLSFATYLLLKNPEVLEKARAHLDAVLGDAVPRIEHLGQLDYIEQILMESLRLWPTAPAFALKPHEDTVIGGKYPVKTTDTVMVLVPELHRDPNVWDTPEAFRPERFAPEAAAALPPNAWKPFGTGARACIGRPFAMQEAQLVLAMMLQRFDLSLDDPDYELKVHETLTLKPENLRIRARTRRSGDSLRRDGSVARPAARAARRVEPAADATPLLVLYGSNTGSAEGFANRIADAAPLHGFNPTVATMDAAAGELPTEGAVVILTASYEGQPPDNARRFVPFAEGLEPGALDGLPFAVFGCGNRQWARTYQAIPKRMDAAMAAAGATRLVDRGEGDSAGDFFGAFDDWIATLWPALAEAFGKTPVAEEQGGLTVDFVSERRESTLRIGDLQLGTVVENRELVDMAAPNARSKRHIEFALPRGMTYRAGDYLAVLASNPDALVDRALRRFGLTADQMVVLTHEGGGATLPTDRPIAVGDLLAHYVELAQPASRAQVAALAEATRCPPEQQALTALAGDGYEAKVLDKRMSVLDLLQLHESCTLDFAAFLGMLPPMRARQYSISSSPLWKPDHATLTIAVVDAPAASGVGQFRGVASTYLAGLEPGDRVAVAVRPSNDRFHPVADPAVPMVMICAGSGLAPFRGFLQERAAQKAAGQDVAPSLLFFGTNHPEVDYLYRDELAAWQAEGVVDVLPVFTDQPEDEMTFVQHRLWAERARVKGIFAQGGTVFTCGDGKYMAPAVRETLLRIYQEETGADDAKAAAWGDRAEHDEGRYVADVFA
ncbi:bifunctional cytochrome P450/NADPH--P450 reductase [Pseudooceanicola sp. LIPI14-2-Ac024]|uniref:bifunctional cytochrome P450/NADPH--P450 reductase n=1 Tax=Pseudooceanicola sp. LIPI14-2-Ac024 TaxID=3344875 RepID=UPI0035D087ED